MRFVLGFLLLGACQSTANHSSIVGKTVGAGGGTVQTDDGTSVAIGRQALHANTNVTISPTPGAPAPQSQSPVGTPYTFGPEGTQFAQPVTVILTLDAVKLPPGKSAADVVIYTAPAGTTQYSALATTPVDFMHVAAQVSHFSVFVPAVAAATEPVDFAAAPNDLSTPARLADLSAPDLTAIDCTLNCTATTFTCGCVYKCGGATDSLACEASSNGTRACNCVTGGSSLKIVNGPGDCTNTTGLSDLYNQCGFGH